MLCSRSWAGRGLTWDVFHQIKERTPLLQPKLRLPYRKLQALAAGDRLRWPGGRWAITVPTAIAASFMANADATGRTTREQLVKANPFLKALTAGDLKNWADRNLN
jgi:hypothetical protein